MKEMSSPPLIPTTVPRSPSGTVKLSLMLTTLSNRRYSASGSGTTPCCCSSGYTQIQCSIIRKHAVHNEVWHSLRLCHGKCDSPDVYRGILLTLKSRWGLTVTRTFLVLFFTWEWVTENMRGEFLHEDGHTHARYKTESFWTLEQVMTQKSDLGFLHGILDPFHNGGVQHLQVTRRPADGAHWVTFQPRSDLSNFLSPVESPSASGIIDKYTINSKENTFKICLLKK